MPESRKRFALGFLLIALISMLVVSASLQNFQLHTGTPFPSAGRQSGNPIPSLRTDLATSGGLANTVVMGILGLAILVFFFFILISLLRRSDLRRFLRNLVLLILLVTLLVLLPAISVGQPASETGNVAPPTPLSPATYPVSPIGEPPQAFVWTILGILIATAISLFLWILLRRGGHAPAQDKILQQAQTAVQALQNGEDFQNVILRCYLQMTRVLKEEQDIERDANLTAREFVELLQKRGLPTSPVQELTSLFEAARYSPLEPTELEEQTGLKCLNEIIQDCQRKAA